MTPTKAVQELAATLKQIPGVVRVHSEGSGGDATIVLTVTGRVDGGPRSWYGFPVRLVREGG